MKTHPRSYGPCPTCQLTHASRDLCRDWPSTSAPVPRDDSRDWPTWPVVVFVVMAALFAEIFCCGCWSGTPPAPREPEFIYVRTSREPPTCRALSRWMRKMPAEPEGVMVRCQAMFYPDWCLYNTYYGYAWQMRIWIDEVVAACREDGDGPGIDP